MTKVDLFLDYFIGKWENRRQALKYSSRFSRVTLRHEKVKIEDKDAVYIQQAYKSKEHNPYRRSIMIPYMDNDDNVFLDSFQLRNNQEYNQLEKSNYTCSFVAKLVGICFVGNTIKDKSIIEHNYRKVIFKSDFKLDKDNYIVNDSGVDLETNARVFGSEFGPFKFTKVSTK